MCFPKEGERDVSNGRVSPKAIDEIHFSVGRWRKRRVTLGVKRKNKMKRGILKIGRLSSV